MISQIVAGIAAIVLAASQSCEPEGDRSPVEGPKPLITSSGDFNINSRFHPKLKASNPTKNCQWWVLWDIPGGTETYNAVELRNVKTRAYTTVDLGKKYTFSYTDPKTSKKVFKKNVRGTTFVTKGCGEWYKK